MMCLCMWGNVFGRDERSECVMLSGPVALVFLGFKATCVYASRLCMCVRICVCSCAVSGLSRCRKGDISSIDVE